MSVLSVFGELWSYGREIDEALTGHDSASYLLSHVACSRLSTRQSTN